jgi:hypothetical protein
LGDFGKALIERFRRSLGGGIAAAEAGHGRRPIAPGIVRWRAGLGV